MEDYLELRDPKVNAQIRRSNLDVRAGRTMSAEVLLKALTGGSPKLERAPTLTGGAGKAQHSRRLRAGRSQDRTAPGGGIAERSII